MKELLVIHAAWTLLYAVLATVSFDKMLEAIVAMPRKKGKAAMTVGVANAVTAVSILLVSLLPIVVLAIAIVKKITIKKIGK